VNAFADASGEGIAFSEVRVVEVEVEVEAEVILAIPLGENAAVA